MFGDILGKMQEMQEKVAATKSRLDSVSVQGESPNANVSVVMTGNRRVKSIRIEESLRQGDAEELEDMIVLAMNHALEKADRVQQEAMSEATGDLLPPHLMNMINPGH